MLDEASGVKRKYRSIVIAFFTFIGGFYFFLEFLLPDFLATVVPQEKRAGLVEFFAHSIPSRGLLEKLLSYSFAEINDGIIRGVQVVGVMAIGLGIISILRVHGGNIVRSRKGWINSLALFVGLCSVMVVEGIDLANYSYRDRQRQEIDLLIVFVGRVKTDYLQHKTAPLPRVDALIAELQRVKRRAEKRFDLSIEEERQHEAKLFTSLRIDVEQAIAEARLLREAYQASAALPAPDIEERSDILAMSLRRVAASVQAAAKFEYERTYALAADHFVYEGLFAPLGAAMFSLLAFYIATAAFRSFRIRSLEALIMMIPALIVMLGQIPQGPLYLHESLPEVRFWLLENISTPAFRAIVFGALIAGLAMAVRMWLSLEKSPLVTEAGEGKGG